MRAARAVEKNASMPLEAAKAAIFGVLLSFVLVVAYALALKAEMIESGSMTVMTTAFKVVSAAAAGLIGARKSRQRLWLWGLASGAAYSLLAFLVFSAVAQSFSPSVAAVADVGMGALAGLCAVMARQALK